MEEGIRSKVYNNNDVFKLLILAHLSLASFCVGYSLNKPMMSIELGQQHSNWETYLPKMLSLENMFTEKTVYCVCSEQKYVCFPFPFHTYVFHSPAKMLSLENMFTVYVLNRNTYVVCYAVEGYV